MDYLVTIVTSKNHPWKAQLDVFKPFRLTVEVDVVKEIDDWQLKEECELEVIEKVSEAVRVPPPPAPYHGGWYGKDEKKYDKENPQERLDFSGLEWDENKGMYLPTGEKNEEDENIVGTGDEDEDWPNEDEVQTRIRQQIVGKGPLTKKKKKKLRRLGLL